MRVTGGRKRGRREDGEEENRSKYIYREVALGRIESDNEASTDEKPQASQAYS